MSPPAPRRSQKALPTLVAVLCASLVTACRGPATRPSSALPHDAPPAAPAAESRTGAPAPGRVVLQLDGGPPSQPVADPTRRPTVLEAHFPDALRGREVDLRIERLAAGEPPAEWLRLRLPVEPDGVLRFAGLPGGRYRVGAQPADPGATALCGETGFAAGTPRAEVRLEPLRAR